MKIRIFFCKRFTKVTRWLVQNVHLQETLWDDWNRNSSISENNVKPKVISSVLNKIIFSYLQLFFYILKLISFTWATLYLRTYHIVNVPLPMYSSGNFDMSTPESGPWSAKYGSVFTGYRTLGSDNCVKLQIYGTYLKPLSVSD